MKNFREKNEKNVELHFYGFSKENKRNWKTNNEKKNFLTVLENFKYFETIFSNFSKRFIDSLDRNFN